MSRTNENTLAKLQDLFYRSQFDQTVREIDEIGCNEQLTAELQLLKANSLFEMHQMDACKAALEEACQASSEDNNYLYALARISHLDEDPERAKIYIQKILDESETKDQKFKATLGLANILYSERNYMALPPLIEKLCSYEPLSREDQRISLMIFLGNYYMGSGTSADMAKSYFKKAMSLASSKTWTFFISRSLYGLACVAEKESQNAELIWTLEILNSFVDESEQKYFAHIVNSKFKSFFTIDTPIEFDHQNTRIYIRDKWLMFHDKPMLFKFLNLLHLKQAFVEKREIAEDLWPDDGYKARVHDPRIFDIAKRARNLIEAYDNQPALLLSGRMGYKLASF